MACYFFRRHERKVYIAVNLTTSKKSQSKLSCAYLLNIEDAEAVNRIVGTYCAGRLVILSLDRWPGGLSISSFNHNFIHVNILEVLNESFIEDFHIAPIYFPMVTFLVQDGSTINGAYFRELVQLSVIDDEGELEFRLMEQLWQLNDRLLFLEIVFHQLIEFRIMLESVEHHIAQCQIFGKIENKNLQKIK